MCYHLLSYLLMWYRKLDQLECGLGESFSITFQTMMSVLILTALSFYYEWHTALVFLGNWPIAVTAGVFLQQVAMETDIVYDVINGCNFVDGEATGHKKG